MMYQLAILLLLSVTSLAGETNDAPKSVCDGCVAEVGSVEIPYDWLLHEFRSTFFRYPQDSNVRSQVFSNLLDRMTLFAAAKESGVQDDAALQARINDQIESTRAFMNYQLEMRRIGLIVEAYLKKSGLDVSQFSVTDEELSSYYKAKYVGLPGAPATVEEAPAEIRLQIREEAVAEKQKKAIEEHLSSLRETLPTTVDEEKVQSVPMPKMEGHVPPGMSDPASR